MKLKCLEKTRGEASEKAAGRDKGQEERNEERERQRGSRVGEEERKKGRERSEQKIK